MRKSFWRHYSSIGRWLNDIPRGPFHSSRPGSIQRFSFLPSERSTLPLAMTSNIVSAVGRGRPQVGCVITPVRYRCAASKLLVRKHRDCAVGPNRHSPFCVHYSGIREDSAMGEQKENYSAPEIHATFTRSILCAASFRMLFVPRGD